MNLMFWKATKEYNIAEYNEAIEELEKVNLATTIDFKESNPKVFCKVFMKTHIKTYVIMNNIAETFNGYIFNVRTKHLYMLEDIITTLMQRLVPKRQEMEKNSVVVCPRI